MINPKEAVGDTKTPHHLVPPRVLEEVAWAMNEGAVKYFQECEIVNIDKVIQLLYTNGICKRDQIEQLYVDTILSTTLSEECAEIVMVSGLKNIIQQLGKINLEIIGNGKKKTKNILKNTGESIIKTLMLNSNTNYKKELEHYDSIIAQLKKKVKSGQNRVMGVQFVVDKPNKRISDTLGQNQKTQKFPLTLTTIKNPSWLEDFCVGDATMPLGISEITSLVLKRLSLICRTHLVTVQDGKLRIDGSYNYRKAGVKFHTYYSSTRRHIDKWYEGEDIDPDSGLHHIVKAIAGLTVLYDSILEGNANDDRPNTI
jgi:hypothetical protein